MHCSARGACAAAVLAALVGVAACARQTAEPIRASQDAGGTASLGLGTIVAMRPVALAVLGAATTTGRYTGAGSDARATILGAIGVRDGGGDSAEVRTDHREAVEFIIRVDNGQTLSVVQPNELTFHPGERVAITRGGRTRLARGAAPSTGS